MRRNMSKVISVALTMSLALSMCACSAKSSVDTEDTTAEAETEIEKEEETEEETVDASGNDVSDNDVSESETEESTLSETEEEEETEASPESKPNAASEEEEEIEEESTNSKTSEKDSTKSETTTSETTTEAVTVQSVSAVVSGTHYVGETLTGADFTVTVKMSDGETLTNPAGWSAQPLTLNSTSNLITVAYEGASVTITVEASVQTASNSGSSTSSSGSTGSTSGTTAGSTASSTTSATTSTTQSSTTSATTGTTAATTQAETTTAAPTTTAAETTASTVIDYTKNGYLTWEPGTVSYEASIALFNAQNDVRASEGHDPFIWSDEMYEAAKLCAKACEDAGGTDHTATAPYRWYTVVYNSAGDSFDDLYGENLQGLGYGSMYVDMVDMWAAECLKAICNSSGHYKQISGEKVGLAAVAAYRTSDGNMIYISYLFRATDEELWIGP